MDLTITQAPEKAPSVKKQSTRMPYQQEESTTKCELRLRPPHGHDVDSAAGRYIPRKNVSLNVAPAPTVEESTTLHPSAERVNEAEGQENDGC
ncbi:hypothetical protein NDU88_001853 [Pleurodeles waltl]|uniref:Uncharacterized protein n=1 Tax=Pleurodeles waltl TaxID=8319 RepID=A0AAV7UVI1_PLEWA|nr:hypothetical protein NDU88_001853 [Pleurodeles waltl]